jgi:hypothetical protein
VWLTIKSFCWKWGSRNIPIGNHTTSNHGIVALFLANFTHDTDTAGDQVGDREVIEAVESLVGSIIEPTCPDISLLELRHLFLEEYLPMK